MWVRNGDPRHHVRGQGVFWSLLLTVLWYALPSGYAVWVLALRPSMLAFFPKCVVMQPLNFISAPGSHRGAEGRNGDGCAPSLYRLFVLHQTLSFCVPVQLRIVEGAPGHNRRGVAETPLPAKSQGRTGDCTF